MIWILATRGASTKLRDSPFTETAIEGVHSVVYRPGVEPVPVSGAESGSGMMGTYVRGLHRIGGFVFSYHGSAAETLFSITAGIDLWIRYRADGARRLRKLKNVIFAGDATVTFPGQNRGLSELIAVPFRVQIPEGDTLANHVEDILDS